MLGDAYEKWQVLLYQWGKRLFREYNGAIFFFLKNSPAGESFDVALVEIYWLCPKNLVLMCLL